MEKMNVVELCGFYANTTNTIPGYPGYKALAIAFAHSSTRIVFAKKAFVPNFSYGMSVLTFGLLTIVDVYHLSSVASHMPPNKKVRPLLQRCNFILFHQMWQKISGRLRY